MSLPVSFFGGAPGGGELLIIFVVLLLLFGAKKLPGIARNLGRTMEEFRRAARDVTDEIMSAPEEPSKGPEKTLQEEAKDEESKDDAAG